ncbi:MAG: SCO family protein [Alphaproteobacteria bacterium]|jgi:protein SCO1/2|nr:SCO family protein [Alphaproteobacteria bacterium]
MRHVIGPKLWLVLLLVGLAMAWSGPSRGASEADDPGRFLLLDQEGREVRNKDFLGRYMLVFFGYTHCPDICPTGLQILAEAMDLLGVLAGKVQPIFITIDPERDRPAVLKDYVSHFHPRLLGLTGSRVEIDRVADRYRVQYRKVYAPDDADGDGKTDYFMEHSAASYLIGPDGGGLSLYPHGMTAEAIAADMRGFIAAR